MNPNDKIRRQILEYFHRRNASATSHMGKKGSAVKISDVKKELKNEYGLSQQEVMSNLTYLLDNGWVKRIDVEKTVVVKGGTIPQVTAYYQVAAKGIDKIEGGSQFEPKPRYAGINITATGQNVITLGDGNIVNADYAELWESLDELKEAIVNSQHVDDAQKLDASVDIESIKDQLAKSRPDTSVIHRLWSGIEKLATVASLSDVIQRIVPLIQSILG